ncbi:hypothetical protein [Montanilutibacter psychrotolerans]|uniref:Uncharacterized protein n=1 Tax=Montanilutibacter psychrotolerans TaxID=1327343 RepID=A0A3M8T0I8_9GAMM|nr:hypothetical protein [Lysobacter psychrotolerans]RNF85034.1 hypothetical protein EER27_04390 [Lysobacter psychrotolerans]
MQDPRPTPLPCPVPDPEPARDVGLASHDAALGLTSLLLGTPGLTANGAVLLDLSTPAYTMAMQVPAELRERIESQVIDNAELQVMDATTFEQQGAGLLLGRLGVDVVRAREQVQRFVERLAGSRGAPLGLAWDGTIMVTASDYQLADTRYRHWLGESVPAPTISKAVG